MNDGAIDRGWIPDFVPTSAFNIFEKHDLDTNEMILKFDIDRVNSIKIDRSCQIVNTVPIPRIPRRLKAHWFSNLKINSADTYYYCNNNRYYIAIDNKTVYYWRFFDFKN